MAFIEWSDNLEIGIEALDGEHRKLVGTINELQAAVSSGEELSRTIRLVAR